MDTSKVDDAYAVLRGKKRIPAADVPPQAWIRVVEDLYREYAIDNGFPGLFAPFQDKLNDMYGHPIVRRGLTRYNKAKGFGVQTSVCSVPIKMVAADETRELLLVRLGSSLQWALWKKRLQLPLRYNMNDIIASEVSWLEPAALLKVCDGFFPYNSYLSHLQSVCRAQVEELQRALPVLHVLAFEVETMRHQRAGSPY